ncbi:MAG: putative exonuclease [Prokaryotic dsDNA virus sp.]|nr:MAG: putative exonuclease [Prokaryotic dsDNA virus sp.]|tara:strand:+ start:3347 stop:3979 length:633 start_codon:yes stop_codon:yes gene_type:complete
MNIIESCEQGSAEWLSMRLGKVTASRVKDVLSKGRGNSPSKTAESYMMELIADVLTGEPKPFFENDAMRWGTETEPQARSMYEVNNGFVSVKEVAFVEHNDQIGISPDGLVGDDGLLEIKCPNTTTQLKRALSDDYSADYKAQIQMQLWVTERQWCDFVSFDPRLDCEAGYLQQRVERDEEYIEEMKIKVYEFVEKMNQLIEQLTTKEGK